MDGNEITETLVEISCSKIYPFKMDTTTVPYSILYKSLKEYFSLILFLYGYFEGE